MEVVSNYIMFLGGLLLDPLKRQVQYIKDLKKNVHHLLEERVELLTEEEDVTQRVDRERLRLMNLSNQNEVDRWLGNVNRLKEQVNGIEREFVEDKRCLNGCLPNYCSRRKLAKETQRLIREVKDLKKNKPSIDVEADQVPPATLMIPTESFKGAAAKMAFKSIRDCLMDEKIAKIGVYGMGGVGKTTIVKNIKNSLQQENIFSEIIFVTISKCLVLKTIQKAIAEQIGLPLARDYNEETLSTMLHEALQRRKRFLLILDDLWRELPLKDIGIPEPHADGKVVLTTRLFSVCQSMYTHKEIKVEVLSPEDAWSLFQENARMDDVVHDPKVKDVAKQMAKECGGLPLAIVTVGRALRGENDVGVWRNALNQLKGSGTDILGMEEGVFEKLKFSFNRLKNEKLQSCFLYCSLFPEDYKIRADVLIDHWIWDGLIHQMENKQAEVDNGRSLLNELKGACMLEFDDGSDIIKMHDLMRDMAIGITRNNPCFMVKAKLRLEKAPTENEWPEDVERISLMNNNIKMLSGQPRCPRLRTLLLNNNRSLSEIIPHSFFDNMCNLRVLDLTRARIEMLPDSICNLEKLNVLLLTNCPLKMMPPLDKLKELRVLRISQARVEELPESLASLENLLDLNLLSCYYLKMLPSFANVKLKILNLSYCTSIEELPESLSNLKNLEELNLSSCGKLKTMPSFANLKKLKMLDLSYTCFEELPESLSNLENLHELHLHGCKNLKRVPSLDKVNQLRILNLSFSCIEELPEGMERLVALESLCLSRMKRLQRFPHGILPKLSLLQKFSTEGSLCLFSSDLVGTMEGRIDCKEITGLTRLTVASFDCDDLPSFFYLIKILQARELRLRAVIKSSQPPSSECEDENFLVEFSRRMPSCSRIEIRGQHDIICLSVYLDSVELDNCYINSCDGMKFVLVGQGNNLLLPKVKNLHLVKLPNLESLHRGTMVQGTLAMLRDIMVFACPKLHNLFSCQMLQSLQSLMFIRVEDCDTMEELITGDDDNNCRPIVLLKLSVLVMSNLQALERISSKPLVCNSLEKVVIKQCPHLKTFPLCIDNLQSIKRIEVKQCNMMEELIVGVEDEIGERIVFPKLKSLALIDLPALERISSKPLVFNSLKEFEINQCPHLKKFPLCINNLQSVYTIRVEHCNTMDELIVGDDDENGEQITLPKLKFLALIDLPSLERISSKPLVCNSLEEIRINECPHLKKFSLCINRLQSVSTIIVEECNTMEKLMVGDEDETGERIVLPKLQYFQLINLPALEIISSKPLVCNSLEEIVINQCPHLKKFPLCIDILQSISKITLEECNTMEELILGDNDETGERIILPKLQSLALINLPALKRINSKLLVCNSLEKIMIKQCPHLKKFSLCINSLESVSTITVEECNTMEELMVGDDDETCERIILPKLKSLALTDLPALERIFSKPLVSNSLEEIKINKCPHLKKLPLCIDSLQIISTIIVQECNTMEELIVGDEDETSERIVLPKLQSLQLNNLPALERISNKPLVCNSMRWITINWCPHLKKFPLCIDSLQSIKQIMVKECNTMEELIVGDDGEIGERVVLPKLKYLALIDLPTLERISSKPPVCNSLEEVIINRCPHLKKFPLCIDSLQSIKLIKVQECNMMEELIVEDDDETGERIVLPKLKSLALITLPALERISCKRLVCNSLEEIGIKQCPHMKMFPLCIDGLQSVSTIIVEECNMMEELMVGDDDEAGERIVLPKLHSLQLINLPALERISCKPIFCNSMSWIAIKRCPYLKKFPLCIDSLQSVSTIILEECNTMEELIVRDDDETSERIVLPKLQSLTLINLPALERISSNPLVCNSLEKIVIKQCPQLNKVSTVYRQPPKH